MKKCVFSTLFFLAFLLGSMCVYNYKYDSYQILQTHNKKMSSNQRFQNAGLINTYLDSNMGYDSIIIGTSMTENFRPTTVAKTMEWNKVLKLSASGASGYEQFLIAKKALATGQVKNVLWGVEAGYWDGNKEVFHQRHTFPKYLYETSYFLEKFALFRYLIGYQTFKLSKLYSNYEPVPCRDVRLEYLNNWAQSASLSFKNWAKNGNIDKLKLKHSETINKKSLYEYKSKEKFPLIEKLLVPLIKQYPKVNFYFFIPPYSRLSLIVGDTDRSLGFESSLVESMKKFENVSIFGFANEKWTTDFQNYKDLNHYSQEINDIIISSMKQKDNVINHKNIKSYQNQEVENIRNYERSYNEY